MHFLNSCRSNSVGTVTLFTLFHNHLCWKTLNVHTCVYWWGWDQLSLQGTCCCREPFAVNGQFLVVSVSGWSGIKCDGQEAQFSSLWVFSFVSESLGRFPAPRQPKCLRAVFLHFLASFSKTGAFSSSWIDLGCPAVRSVQFFGWRWLDHR